MRYLALALVLALLVAQLAQAELPRHTPGFPEVGSWQWLEEILRDPRLLEALRVLAGAELSYRELLEVLLPKEALPTDVANELDSSISKELSDLVAKLGDPKLEALIEDIKGGEVSREELVKVLEYLDHLRSSGALNLSNYIALLVGLVDTLRESGFEIPQELLSRLGTALAELVSTARPGGDRQLAEVPTNPEPSLLRPDPGAFVLGVQLPAISLPGLPLGYLLVAIVAVATIALALYLVAPKLPRPVFLRPRLSTLHTGASGTQELDVVELYWKAVELVSRAMGIPREDHVTHREYLARFTALATEPLLSSFSALTQAYELYRYGWVRSEAVVGVARTAYERVVESLGRL